MTTRAPGTEGGGAVRLITVCDHCLRPSCWSGGFECLAAAWSLSREMPEFDLRRMAAADPQHFAVDLRPGGALATPPTGSAARAGTTEGE